MLNAGYQQKGEGRRDKPGPSKTGGVGWSAGIRDWPEDDEPELSGSFEAEQFSPLRLGPQRSSPGRDVVGNEDNPLEPESPQPYKDDHGYMPDDYSYMAASPLYQRAINRGMGRLQAEE